MIENRNTDFNKDKMKYDEKCRRQLKMVLKNTIKNGVSVYFNQANGMKYVGKTIESSRMTIENNILDICKGCPYIIDNCFVQVVENTDTLMMPFFEFGDVYDACLRKLLPSQIRRISQQVLLALKYMHQRSVIHRDIKPANVVLTNSSCYFDVKVIDFGTAAIFETNSPPTDRVGTPNYAAPEVFKRMAQSSKSDIWSFGVMIYAITALKVPFTTTGNFDISSISYEHSHFKSNPALVDFLKSIFKINPNQRPSAETLLQHDWVR